MGIHVNSGDFSKILTFIIKPLQNCCLQLVKNLLLKVHLISFMVVVNCIKVCWLFYRAASCTYGVVSYEPQLPLWKGRIKPERPIHKPHPLTATHVQYVVGKRPSLAAVLRCGLTETTIQFHMVSMWREERFRNAVKLSFLQLKYEARNTNVDSFKKTEHSCIRFMKPTRAACAQSVSKGSGRPKSPPWGLWCHPKLFPRKGWWTHRRHPSGKDRGKNSAISQAAWGSRETVHYP